MSLVMVKLMCRVCEQRFSLGEFYGLTEEGRREANDGMANQVREILKHQCRCAGCQSDMTQKLHSTEAGA